MSLRELLCLNLENNHIGESLSTTIGQLTLLTSMRLGSNRLTGSIPPQISALTNLVVLSLGSNQLKGKHDLLSILSFPVIKVTYRWHRLTDIIGRPF